MGTRGAYGFRKGNRNKLTYNHYDSYFDYLGNNLLKEIHNIGNSEKLLETYNYIKLVDGNTKPTEEQIKECEKYFCDSVSTGEKEEWYSLLREVQGTIMPWVDKEFPYMINSNSFIKDTTFCEYYYIIDVSKDILVAHKTFDKLDYEIPLADIYSGKITSFDSPLLNTEYRKYSHRK